MKISLALLVLLLAAAWAGTAGNSFRSSRVQCCSKQMFSRQRIPAFRIREYEYTSPNCTHRAVLLTLRRGSTVCVDPEESWFQQYLGKKKKPSSTSR